MRRLLPFGLIGGYLVFVSLSFFLRYAPGKDVGYNFFDYFISMMKILPCIFILIGLFEVWVKREVIEKHLGKDSGARGYFWAVLLGSVTVGPMIVALPVAHSLFRKGAGIQVILAYLGASSVCRIPMTLFEISCVGVKFTLVRYAVSLPLIIIFASLYGLYLEKKGYAFPKTE